MSSNADATRWQPKPTYNPKVTVFELRTYKTFNFINYWINAGCFKSDLFLYSQDKFRHSIANRLPVLTGKNLKRLRKLLHVVMRAQCDWNALNKNSTERHQPIKSCVVHSLSLPAVDIHLTSSFVVTKDVYLLHQMWCGPHHFFPPQVLKYQCLVMPLCISYRCTRHGLGRV